MKVEIDRDGCIECGLCMQTCPEVFVLESGQKAYIIDKYQTGAPGVGDVPQEASNCAEDAASVCPVQVISTKR